MPELRIPITVEESRELERLVKKLSKTKRSIVREALSNFFEKQKNHERGLDVMYVRAPHNKQVKLDLD